LVTYLAKQTGHRCVRINNHGQTDLQEYLGSYVADESGRLVFREGALVTALRKGHWVVLDELNLAPSEVLEALNRYCPWRDCAPTSSTAMHTHSRKVPACSTRSCHD
jgi:midasin (ATPase involved in ribosome maturation)